MSPSEKDKPEYPQKKGAIHVIFSTSNVTDTPKFGRAGFKLTGLQSFLYVQAPTLARPPDCTDRWDLGTFPPQGRRAVYTTQWTTGYPLELWHRYMHESGNLHDGTPTRWSMALSAATFHTLEM
jgi:hypothetical protein